MKTARGTICAWAATSLLVGGCESGTKKAEHAINERTAETLTSVPQPPNSYSLFETLQVRPLALSADGKTLFAVNTPDNRLELFKVNGKKKNP